MRITAPISIAAVLVAACVPPQSSSGSTEGYDQAGVSFTGTYVTEGATVTLQESGGQVAGTIQGDGVSGQIQGVIADGALSGTVTMSDGSAGNLVAYASAEGLQVAVDGRPPIVLARVGAGDAVAGPPAPIGAQGAAAGAPSSPAAAPVASGDPPPAPRARPATGAAYRDDMDGWEVRTPPAWKHGVKGSAVVFGSDTEAGMIIVAFNRGVSYEQMEASVGTVIAQLGATQLGPPRAFKAKGGKGLVVEMSGRLPDGATVHARAAGVAGPRGIVSVTGITTPQKIDGLRKRVDAIALSARFFKPRPSAAMKILAGPWWHYHSVGDAKAGSDYERTLELCADGTFYDSSNSNISVSVESRSQGFDGWGNPISGSTLHAGRSGSQAGAGRWTATGDNRSGRLRLVFHNGNVEERQYVFRKPGGGDIELDGRWYGYARDHGGQCR